MGPATAIKTGFARPFQFKGRASRAEFWWFAVFCLVLIVALGWLDRQLWPQNAYFVRMDSASGGETFALQFGASLMQGLAFVALLVPVHAVGWRRCHNANLPGLWVLLPWAGLFGVVAIALLASMSEAGFPAMLMLLVLAAPLLITILILAQRGTTGPNRFGPNPHEVPQ